jgi:VanZ family protein
MMTGARGAPSRAPSRVFVLAMVVFIIYGSLYPFDFLAEPLPIDRFYAEWRLFDNTGDAVDNFILFVPLGIGLHIHYASTRARWVASVLSVLVLAIGVQLVQLYLPSRTSAVSDAVWNTVGLVAGLMVAARVRPLVAARMSREGVAHDYFALLLVALWFIYESFPFVPTLDIGELRGHIKTAIVAPPFEFMRLAQHGLAALMAGVAVQRTNWLLRRRDGVLLAGGIAITLEILVAYGSLRRETLLGIALGMATAYWLARRRRGSAHGVVLALALATNAITVAIPYRGQGRDGGFTATPFAKLLWRGLPVELVPASYEALAIGALLWAGIALAGTRARANAWTAAVLLLLLAGEWARIAVFGIHGDSSTVLMFAVLAPAALALRCGDEVTPAPAPAPMRARAPAPGLAGGSALVWIVASVVGLALAMAFVLSMPTIPYNLKNLFGSHHVRGPAFFALALLWLGAGPWAAVAFVVRRQARGHAATGWLPLLVMAMAIVSYALLNIATPDIMLEKIIGAPDLRRRIVDDGIWGEAWRAALVAWPAALLNPCERLIRYIGLYAVFMIPLVVAMLGSPTHDRRPRVLAAVVVLLPFWWMAKVLVLDWSITDNLTELVAPGGAWLLLGLIIALFALHASVLGHYAERPRAWAGLLALTLAALPASWYLLNQGIEHVVINGDRMFSGIQFLLGPNRDDLLSTFALFIRWSVLYCAGVAVTAWGIHVGMRVLPLSSTSFGAHHRHAEAELGPAGGPA